MIFYLRHFHPDNVGWELVPVTPSEARTHYGQHAEALASPDAAVMAGAQEFFKKPFFRGNFPAEYLIDMSLGHRPEVVPTPGDVIIDLEKSYGVGSVLSQQKTRRGSFYELILHELEKSQFAPMKTFKRVDPQ